MLKQRLVTALVLLAILLPALFWPSPHPFVGLALLLVAAGAWEWGRLNGLKQSGALVLAALCVALCVWTWAGGWLVQTHTMLWGLTSLAWVLVGAGVLSRGVEAWLRYPQSLRLAAGVLALWTTWLAVAQARTQGINLLLSMLALVWAADVAAYFAGRAFGLRWTSRRLAPSISPGKSWEGVWGGMLGVLAVGTLWRWLDAFGWSDSPSLFTQLGAQSVWMFVCGLILLSAMSVVGDLVESLCKRAAGAKDSSGLLPGHGGVLDRLDALLPTLPIAMCLMGWFR